MALPRASHVCFNPTAKCLEFVYDEKPGKLHEVEMALSGIPGVAYVPPSAYEGGSVIPVALQKGVNVAQLLATLKKVLNPKLEIGVYILELTVRRCRQNIHNEATCVPTFVPGFHPKNKDHFLNRLHIEVVMLNLREFFPIDAPPNPRYVLAMRQLFKRLGANVQEADLRVDMCC